MNLTPMRYKGYTWPHNPRVYSIDFQRAVAAHKMPFGRYQLQDLGMGHRRMEGEGEFVGEGAYVEFQRLASVFYEDGPGLLVHPLWQVSSAYFVSLRVEQMPRPNYVQYSFAFLEEYSLYNSLATRVVENVPAEPEGNFIPGAGQAFYHRVAQGDTLWGLSRHYGVPLAELVERNPQIKNPNLIRVGEEVRIR